MCSVGTIVNNTELYIAKLLREQVLKFSSQKIIVTVVMDDNQTCSDYFIIYTNIEQLCCIPEIIVTCQLYLNFLKREERQPRIYVKKGT